MSKNGRYNTVLLFGAPGAGKGTQGNILGSIPGFFHISSGEIFRTLDVNSELGKLFYEKSSAGELVPDEATVEIWCQNIHARTVLGMYKPHSDLLILDGIPRNLSQAKAMEKHIKMLCLIHLVGDDEAKMMERLKRRALVENRTDDLNEEVIRRRWEIYNKITKPILDYYPPSTIFSVSAVGSQAEVLQRILKIIIPQRANR